MSFGFHRFSLPYRESGLRVVTPPEWIIFLCIPRTQQKNSLGHQIKRKLVCPIHLVGVLQKVSDQSLIFLSLNVNETFVFPCGWMSFHGDECLHWRNILSFHVDECLFMGMKRQNIKFIKDLEDLSRQYVGMFKTRKIGLSWRLFRDRKISDWTETFCKTPTRWIGHTNFLFIWCPRLCFGWVLSMQRKIIHSGGVTTLNPDSLERKENLWKLKING